MARLDTQQIELIGRSLLAARLMADGLEVALPERDRGIDLIVYVDLDECGRFLARPVQMKAASAEAFGVDRKYARFPDLLLAYVWNVAEPSQLRTLCMTQAECVSIADAMGWTRTRSWERGEYTTSRPGTKLRALLEPHEMHAGDWRRKLVPTEP
jgi:hypothetical protein